MSALQRAFFERLTKLPALLHLPARGGEDAARDHGHLPLAAWEAELAAYARLRTGTAIKVIFTVGAPISWGDEIHLPRPPSQLTPEAAFAAAEVQVEHLLGHVRHGWREEALLWHILGHPDEPITLPWAPWDHATLPPSVVKLALLEAVPELDLPPSTNSWRERQRCAAAWIAAAWGDGVHRQLEIEERPGMAERLPAPPDSSKSPKQNVWESLLLALAGAAGASPDLASLAEPFGGLKASGTDALSDRVAAIVALVEALQLARALPPAHQQRPPWLQPLWGRWHRAAKIQSALLQIARSPATAAIAAATVAGRTRTARSGRGASDGRQAATSLPLRARESRSDDAPPRAAAAPAEEEAKPQEWGVQDGEAHAEQVTPRAVALDGAPGMQEGQQPALHGTSGAGPGTLGALRVVSPSPADRAAYWQLRAALTPLIERLIERLRATSDASFAAAPHRFRRAGRLDRGRLPAAMAGRETVFKEFVHDPEPEHALCLLLDCSASMAPYAETLREYAILVEAATSALGARVSAFTFGASWERLETEAHGAPLIALGRELHPHGGTPFGPAVEAAAEWLAQQPYEQKRLWVFSDGRWSARDRGGVEGRPAALKHAVVWVLGETAPASPDSAMRIEVAPTLDDLIDRAPSCFWERQHRPELP